MLRSIPNFVAGFSILFFLLGSCRDQVSLSILTATALYFFVRGFEYLTGEVK